MTHTFSTPAKINLFLKIGEIDELTSLHEIQSVMVPVSLFDTISVKKAKTTTINTYGINENIPTEKNIIYKMFLAIEKYTGKKLPEFEITIEKKIPTGAGLGGGSSNAAGFLMFVNKQLKLGLSKQDMINIAATVGSDVPFFILRSPAFVSGTGDKLNPVTINSQGKSLLLIYPEITVNSGLAYSLFDKKKLTKTEGVTINTVRNFDCRSLKDWTTVIHNDFEDVVFSQWPKIEALKNEFEKLAQTAFMSGSGSAVIGVFSSLEQREHAYEILRDKYRLIE